MDLQMANKQIRSGLYRLLLPLSGYTFTVQSILHELRESCHIGMVRLMLQVRMEVLNQAKVRSSYTLALSDATSIGLLDVFPSIKFQPKTLAWPRDDKPSYPGSLWTPTGVTPGSLAIVAICGKSLSQPHKPSFSWLKKFPTHISSLSSLGISLCLSARRGVDTEHSPFPCSITNAAPVINLHTYWKNMSPTLLTLYSLIQSLLKPFDSRCLNFIRCLSPLIPINFSFSFPNCSGLLMWFLWAVAGKTYIPTIWKALELFVAEHTH